MQDIFEAYATDQSLERQGVEISADLIPHAKFLVARAGGANEAFGKEGEKRFRPHRRAIEQGKLDAKEGTRLAMELFIDTQLKGWTGVNVRKRDESGKGVSETVVDPITNIPEVRPVFVPLEYTRENAIKLFTTLPDLHLELQRKAQKIETFQRADTEDDAKN